MRELIQNLDNETLFSLLANMSIIMSICMAIIAWACIVLVRSMWALFVKKDGELNEINSDYRSNVIDLSRSERRVDELEEELKHELKHKDDLSSELLAVRSMILRVQKPEFIKEGHMPQYSADVKPLVSRLTDWLYASVKEFNSLKNDYNNQSATIKDRVNIGAWCLGRIAKVSIPEGINIEVPSSGSLPDEVNRLAFACETFIDDRNADKERAIYRVAASLRDIDLPDNKVNEVKAAGKDSMTLTEARLKVLISEYAELKDRELNANNLM